MSRVALAGIRSHIRLLILEVAKGRRKLMP